jgi:hypothetical protein
MLPPKIFYLQKLDNPPLYNAGKELHTVEYHRGWIEYLNETSDVYYSSGLTEQQYRLFLPVALDWILKQYRNKDYKSLGLLKQLLSERLEQPFAMPMMSDLRIGNRFSCGTTRFTASVLCGVDPAEIPVVFQVNKNQTDSRLGSAQLVSSTAQINQLADLEDKEFTLSFSQDSNPVVLSSTLRNSVYEEFPTLDTFKDYGNNILNFWNRYTTDNRINIVISCDNATKSLIKFSEDIWNAEFCNLEHTGFGFGQILEKFGKPGPGQLNLYVYNIEEEFNLEYLIPWTHPNNVWFHTLNKKVHLFDTTRGPNSACWPIVAIGNFVK